MTAMREAAFDIGKRSWPEQRAAYDALSNRFAPPLRRVVRERVDAGGVPAEWFVPRDLERDDRALVYFHGGAYIFGSTTSHAELIARIAIACRTRVLAPNYRLAPEHPFPAAIDDALATWRFLAASGVEPKRIAIAGDSAGGNMAVALLLRLRDAGEPLPSCAALLCPWVDLTAEGGSFVDNAAFDWGDKPTFDRWIATYLAGHDPKDPLVSPVYADLSRLPALLVQIGSAELLLDQATALAMRAEAHGTDVRFAVEPDMVHDWHSFAGLFPRCGKAIEDIAAFVRSHLG